MDKGTPLKDGQFGKKASSVKRPEKAKLGHLDSTRLGYGTGGVDVKDGGGGKSGPSQFGRAERDFTDLPASLSDNSKTAPYNP